MASEEPADPGDVITDYDYEEDFGGLDDDRGDWHQDDPCCDDPDLDEATTGPYDWAGHCAVLVVCHSCGWQRRIGTDSVL